MNLEINKMGETTYITESYNAGALATFSNNWLLLGINLSLTCFLIFIIISIINQSKKKEVKNK